MMTSMISFHALDDVLRYNPHPPSSSLVTKGIDCTLCDSEVSDGWTGWCCHLGTTFFHQMLEGDLNQTAALNFGGGILSLLLGSCESIETFLQSIGLTKFQAVVVFGMLFFGYLAKLGELSGLQPEAPHLEDDHED